MAPLTISGFDVQQRYKSDKDNWQLIWSDEFDRDGPVNSENWSMNIWPAKGQTTKTKPTPRELKIKS